MLLRQEHKKKRGESKKGVDKLILLWYKYNTVQ